MLNTKPLSESALIACKIAALVFVLYGCTQKPESISLSVDGLQLRAIQSCNLPANSPKTAYLILSSTDRRAMVTGENGETATIQHQLKIGQSVTIDIDVLVAGSETTVATATKTITSANLNFSAADYTLTDENENGVIDCFEYLIAEDGSLSWPDSDLSFNWAIEVSGNQLYGTPVITDGNLIVTASGATADANGVLEAFNYENINLAWSTKHETSQYHYADHEVVMDQNGNFHLQRSENSTDRLYLYSYDGTGNLIDSPYVGGVGQLHSGPSIDQQGRAVFTHSPTAIALRALDGGVLIIEDIKTGTGNRTKPAISTSGIAYFTVPTGTGIVSVDLESGESLTTCPASDSWSSPAIDNTGNIIFGTREGKVYACTAQMKLAWVYPLGVGVKAFSASPVIDKENNVYVRSHNGIIYKLDSEGVEEDRYDTGIPSDEFGNGTPLLTKNGHLIFVNEAGVTVLDTDSMEPVAKFGVEDLENVNLQSRGQFSFALAKRSDLTMTPSEMLVFRAETYLVAIQMANTGGLAEHGWPKWGADLRNSGLQQ